jgi:predicted RNA binding protein YcfA (HicA-like mRNA interferase family)
MPELPHISGKQAVKIFEKLGFTVIRQKGSHVVLRRGDRGCVAPLHKRVGSRNAAQRHSPSRNHC